MHGTVTNEPSTVAYCLDSTTRKGIDSLNWVPSRWLFVDIPVIQMLVAHDLPVETIMLNSSTTWDTFAYMTCAVFLGPAGPVSVRSPHPARLQSPGISLA